MFKKHFLTLQEKLSEFSHPTRFRSVFLILITIGFCLLPVAEVIAQSGGFAGSFSRMGFSPRGMGMGNAMTAVQTEGSFAYYNPALAARPAGDIQLDFSTAALRFDRQLHMAHAHFSLPPSAGLSFSLINARVSDIDGRTQSGYHTDYLSASEYQLIGNFALRFTDRFWGGIGLKYNLANYHRDLPKSSSIGLDAGLRLQIHPDISVAVAVKDLLSEQNVNSSDLYGTERTDHSQSFPTRLIAGISFDLSEQWLISFDIENRYQSSEISRMVEGDSGESQARMVRENTTSTSNFARLGARYQIHERLTIRGGLQYIDIGEENVLQPSAGFSIHLPYDHLSPSIDYAFMREPSQLSTLHVFAIRLHI
jgi:hypothetical protein